MCLEQLAGVQDERRFRAKLCDFGLSVHLTPGQAGAEPSQGTEAYLPLEALQRVEITPATEVYSLGLVLWEIYYGILWFSAWDGERRRRKCAPAPFCSGRGLFLTAPIVSVPVLVCGVARRPEVSGSVSAGWGPRKCMHDAAHHTTFSLVCIQMVPKMSLVCAFTRPAERPRTSAADVLVLP